MGISKSKLKSLGCPSGMNAVKCISSLKKDLDMTADRLPCREGELDKPGGYGACVDRTTEIARKFIAYSKAVGCNENDSLEKCIEKISTAETRKMMSCTEDQTLKECIVAFMSNAGKNQEKNE